MCGLIVITLSNRFPLSNVRRLERIIKVICLLNMPQGSYLSAAVATTGVLAGAYCVYHLYNEAQKRKLPTTWREVGSLKDIYIYPIKSCGPVRKDRAECTLLGLKDGWLRDRALMVVDDKYNFITAISYPVLLLVRQTMRNSVLILQHSDMEILYVDLSEVALKPIQTSNVCGVEVPVHDCGYEASEWLSRLLDNSADNFRLVLYASNNSRKLKIPANNMSKFRKTDTGALPDELPFHLMNQASVDDLNTKLQGNKVCYKNFRPNFLITGAGPYEEDDWKYVKIGENIFEVIKPCTSDTTEPESRPSTENVSQIGLHMILCSGTGGFVSINDRVYVA
ncbi:unnamed protein product [Danaus chrysippus]|uniref:(African queen) hypothetical protein n=1 Tax=Danaus chrysippus TaxID=151541 RepID=A0A8J2QLD1_9NEOP|nr:unnamed protein product [Danaus chrysippus]